MAETFHMIGYIREGPDALSRTLDANRAAVRALAERAKQADIQRILVTGVGSSYTAAMMALPTFRYHCPLPTYVMPASEFPYYVSRLVDKHSLVIAVSRSGERGAVVDALAAGMRREALAVGVTGSKDSLLARESQVALVTAEGAEITFPKTKSVIAGTGLLMAVGLALANQEDAEAAARLEQLEGMPGRVKRSLDATEPRIKELLPNVTKHAHAVFLGTGSNFGTAIEAAMKVQEAAYVTTRFDSTDGLLNGPVGGLDSDWLVVPMVHAYDAVLTQELLRVVRSVGAHSLCLTEPGLDLHGLEDWAIALPEAADALLGALVYLPPLQLLTYYWSLARDRNPDSPAAMRAILDAVLSPGREEPELRKA